MAVTDEDVRQIINACAGCCCKLCSAEVHDRVVRLQAALSLPVSNTGENAYVAILRHNDDPNNLKAVLVPLGQTLEFDEDTATRRWLWPHLGYEFHLVAFVPLEAPK